MSDAIRTRIASTVDAHERVGASCKCGFSLGLPAIVEHWQEHLADAVIRELVELRRINQVREVCVASLNLDRTAPGEVFCDREWLADTILNVLNGAVDD